MVITELTFSDLHDRHCSDRGRFGAGTVQRDKIVHSSRCRILNGRHLRRVLVLYSAALNAKYKL